jgi:trk system potassium uptake protein TrkA
MTMKEYAVIGLGNFGATVARELNRLKCRVTAIDNDKGRVQLLQDEIHLGVLADATDRDFLENLDVRKFECCVVSTGENTHASILITLHLKQLGARQIIVKARSEDHASILKAVGATEAIIPEKQMAVKIAHSMAKSNLMDYLPLSESHYVAELPSPPKFVGKTLKDLKISSKFNVQVIAIKDTPSDKINFAPGGEYRIKGSDILVVLGESKDIERLKP